MGSLERCATSCKNVCTFRIVMTSDRLHDCADWRLFSVGGRMHRQFHYLYSYRDSDTVLLARGSFNQSLIKVCRLRGQRSASTRLQVWDFV
jgi:hypothetical protein